MRYQQPSSLIPADELARIHTLYQYQILNTTTEKIFDDYVTLTAQLFNLPVSLISLVEEERVFFKANAGMAELPTHLPRTDSLCSAAVLENSTLIFPDLRQERCQLVNPAVAESAGLRCYAGAPLRMPGGHNIGTLCVIGYDARQFTDNESELLARLAHLVGLTIELRAQLLKQGAPEQWQDVQLELQGYLRESSTLARYLAARTSGAAFFSDELQQTVARRLDGIEQALRRHLDAT